MARGVGAGLAACLLLAVQARGAVTLEEAVSHYEATNSPATLPSIQAGTDQAYVLFIVTESNSNVTAVSGGSLTWTERKEQCAGTNQTGIRVWTAQGSPGAAFQVQITYGGGGLDLTAVLARYSGVLSFEDPTGQNVAGENDTACSTSTQNSTAQLTLTSTQDTSVHAIGICPKTKTVSSVSSGYSLVDSEASGAAFCYVYHREVATAATDAFSATLSGNARWATAGLVLNPVPTTNYRSIGTDNGILAGPGGTATVSLGSTTVTIGGPALPANVGQGDRLTIGGGSPNTLFSDTFSVSDGGAGWTCIASAGGCNLSESGGHFNLDNTDSSVHYTIDAGTGWTDYTFTIDFNNQDDDLVGISARVQDANNYYLLRQSFGDGTGSGADDSWLRLRKVVAGTATNLASFDGHPGTGNHVLKLQVIGSNIKAWVDGVLKFNVTDTTFASGTAGIYTWSHNDGWFDNALVQGTDDGVYYIASRDSHTQVTIQEEARGGWTSAAYEIERVYNTLQAWEDDRDGSLVAEARREVGVCFDDEAFTARLTVSGSTTDASHFMKLTAASGQRHNGMKNTGARIDAQGGWGSLNAIDVEDPYTVIDGLEIKGIDDAGNGVFFDNSPASDNSLASSLFVHSCTQNAAVRIGALGVTVRNSLFTGGTTNAILLLATGSASIDTARSSATRPRAPASPTSRARASPSGTRSP